MKFKNFIWFYINTTISETMYIRLDTPRDGIHPFPIGRSWKEVSGSVNAVFSYGDKIYIIQVKQNTAVYFKGMECSFHQNKYILLLSIVLAMPFFIYSGF